MSCRRARFLLSALGATVSEAADQNGKRKMIFRTPRRRSHTLTVLVAALAAVAAVTACSSPAGGPAVQASPAGAVQPVRAAKATGGPAAALMSEQQRPAPAARRAGDSPALPAGARRVTFVNKVRQTIWVAAAQNPTHPLRTTGWVLRPGHSVTIVVPNHWNGRFWGRTGCVFRNGVGHCQTGDCAGRFQCTGNGAIPATLAEYDLDAFDGLDFYDVSMVDGSNLPMYINVTSGKAARRVGPNGCIPAGCTKPVACPKVLRVRAGGKVVACESACARFGTDQYCCRGKWAPRSACNPAKWPVDYAAVFKRAEPYAYSYVDDDATSVYTCQGRCDYRIVFGITQRR
jgi:Thaumatin family